MQGMLDETDPLQDKSIKVKVFNQFNNPIVDPYFPQRPNLIFEQSQFAASQQRTLAGKSYFILFILVTCLFLVKYQRERGSG